MQEITSWYRYERSRKTNLGYLSFQEECFLISLLSTKDREKALEELIKHHISIVHNIARNYKWCAIPYEDLVQYGVAGLISAADRFDISKGNKFSTYAHHYVLGRIRRALEYYNNLIRKPAHINMAESKLNGLDLEKEISDEELEKLSTDKFSISHLRIAISTKKMKIVDLSDFESEQVQNIDEVESKIAVENILKHLNDREQKCIALRFGLLGYQPHQHKEIDKIVGCDSEQVIAYAFRRLRRSKLFKDLMDIL